MVPGTQRSAADGFEVATGPVDRGPIARASAKGGVRSALVLDDSLETSELIRFFLEPYFESTVAQTADEVFSSTWERRFDVVLLDINLGDEEWSGLDVMSVLRKLPEYETTPIVAVTAYALPGDAKRFVDAGFDGYVSKPFVRGKLLAELERVLGPFVSEEDVEARQGLGEDEGAVA